MAMSVQRGPRGGNALAIGMVVIVSSPEQASEQSYEAQDSLLCDACEEVEACYRRTDGLLSCAECAVEMDDCELIPLEGGATGEPL